MGAADAEYAPPITFMVVQKRHHTRFFPQTPQAGDRSGNVQPGANQMQGIGSTFDRKDI